MNDRIANERYENDKIYVNSFQNRFDSPVQRCAESPGLGGNYVRGLQKRGNPGPLRFQNSPEEGLRCCYHSGFCCVPHHAGPAG
eukprot:1207675-Amphidinium_carterae.1